MTKSDTDSSKTDDTANGFRSFRELIEALGIALVLAFLFKAFIIELYCIPTGSMASTLMGRHKDVNCEVCGFPFQFSASQESNDGADNPRAKDQLPLVIGGTCPQCQYTMYVGEGNIADQVHMSFNGDRIFVNKSLFSYREPSRWHVSVFRYPAKPQVNYIKRLVGVPNETVMLRNGQVFTKKEGDDHFEIQRKPLRVLLSMMRPVDDNNYVIPAIHELGWKTRWYGDEGWARSADYKSFTGTSGEGEESWLKFRYITATTMDWHQLIQGHLPGHTGMPQLITDSLDYNSSITHLPPRPLELFTVPSFLHGGTDIQMPSRDINGIGLNWVGDLAVRCSLTIEKAGGDVSFQLVKGGIIFQCDIEDDSPALFEGDFRARFEIPDVPEFKPFSVNLPMYTGRKHDIMFCNVDEEMRLIIDGREVDTQGRGRYDHLCLDGSRLSRDRSPTVRDLEPAAIGVQRGASVLVENLKILRNMYYISASGDDPDPMCDLINSPFRYDHSPFRNDREEGIRRILSDPEYLQYFGKTRRTEFPLGNDQFLMCGDNSSASKDSRLWTRDDRIPHYVERQYMIGEALYVFWPHGHRIPGTRLALIPNFPKMRWID
ncbi:MAG: S26 family signal peptidase [Planctomycetaceae bacterium]|nr:S26 family signal peptidase [Planctomycetaceae bacterium]